MHPIRPQTPAGPPGAAAAVLSDHPCVLGEGIAFDPWTGCLRWFDIARKERLEHDPLRGGTRRLALPETTSAGAFVDGTREVLFTETGLFLRDRASGRQERLAAIEADRPDLRCNDGRTHPSGAFWCSTMSRTKAQGAGSIYWFFRGEVRRLYPGLTVGNAICFTQAGDVAYFSDTPAGTIWRVAADPLTGLPAGEPAVFHQGAPGEPGGPDGAVLDRDGLLYSARWGGARVDVFAPDGRRVRAIRTGGLQTTCPAFFGPDLSALAVTTARDEMTDEELLRYPASGQTFRFEAGCRGRLDAPIRLA